MRRIEFTQAGAHAQAHHVYGHRDVATNYHGFRMVVAGARWQREALLTDESVGRAARAMDENFNPDRHPIMAAMFRDYAKTALMSALGIEGDE